MIKKVEIMDLAFIVEDLNLDNVKRRLVEEAGYEEQIALTSVDMYRKFLFLKAAYSNEALVPPKLVDDAWHEHILFTKNYAETCDKLCGEFVHHTPMEEEPTAAELAEHSAGWARTKELFKKEFHIDLESSTVEGMRIAGTSQ